MKLNRVEYWAMNNPVRALVQRRLEARWLRKMGGGGEGLRCLEIGCGRGVGVELILDRFGASEVDAFDLDPAMVARARRRLRGRSGVRLWTGDATQIEAEDASYGAVFDFGIVHHIPDWQSALHEIHRVLKPGGLLYAEEVLARFIHATPWRQLLDHPRENRFDAEQFLDGLETAGFDVLDSRSLMSSFVFAVAQRRTN